MSADERLNLSGGLGLGRPSNLMPPLQITSKQEFNVWPQGAWDETDLELQFDFCLSFWENSTVRPPAGRHQFWDPSLGKTILFVSDHYKLVFKSIETLQHPTWPDNQHQPLGFQSDVIRVRASQSSEEPTAQARPLRPESGRVDWWAGRPEENDFIIVMNKNLVKVGRLEGLLNYCFYKHIIYVAQFIRALTKWLLKYFLITKSYYRHILNQSRNQK